jgi:hypothetical protein
MARSAELHNQLELGECVVSEDMCLCGSEAGPFFAPDRPVVLEALTNDRLFLRFGKPLGRLQSYYMVHVLSAQIMVEPRPWPIVPALASCALMFVAWDIVLFKAVFSLLAVGFFIGFFRMRHVLELSVAGGRQFRFTGDLPVLEDVASKLARQIKKREALADTVYKAPPPIIFPPRAVVQPQVLKEVVTALPPVARAARPAPPPAVRPVPAPPAPRPAPQASPPGRDWKFCHMCGCRLRRSSRFCPECGERQ